MQQRIALNSFIKDEFCDLGARDPAFSGILTPASAINDPPTGLTAQFTEVAGEYATRYANSAYFKSLIERGLGLVGFTDQVRDVLDFGAGAGDNSTFPCLELYPHAQVLATDLSPQLLVLLRDEAHRRGLSSQVAPLCLDAMNDVFLPECFDLVIGSAILHHLINPSAALEAAYKALRPGGVALFFEPFEAGNAMLCMLFERIMAEANLRNDPLPPLTLHFFHLFTMDVHRRIGRDKSADYFREVDDKWLFGRPYFYEVGQKLGYSKVSIDPIEKGNHQMQGRSDALLRLAAGSSFSQLPDWAQHHIQTADRLLVESIPDLISEAIVALMK